MSWQTMISDTISLCSAEGRVAKDSLFCSYFGLLSSEPDHEFDSVLVVDGI